MVMPCSRSASNPSVSNDKSMPVCPRRWLDFSMEDSWSSNMALVSYSNRPINVLFPSSTLPALLKRSMPVSTGEMFSIADTLEISFLFAQLHGRLGSLIIHSGSAALRYPGHRRLGDDFCRRCGNGLHWTRARHVPDRAESNRHTFHHFICFWLYQVRYRQQSAGPAHHITTVCEIDRRHAQTLTLDVLPDIQLGPVADWKNADVFALVHTRVVKAPKFRSLVLGIPLAKLIAEGKNTFFGARFFLIAPRSSDAGIETVLRY